MDLSAASGSSARVTFVGHSTVEIVDRGARLLADPVLRDRIGPLVRVAAQRGIARPFATGSAPDAVLITHAHRDHLDLPSLRSLGRDLRLIVPPGATRFVARHGFTQTEELAVGRSTAVGDVEVTAVEARHGGSRNIVGPEVATQGYVVAGNARTYLAGDTGLFGGMAELGPLDLALLPVWGWGTSVGSGHLTPVEAAAALALIRPHLAVPVHWGSFHLAGRARAMRRHLVDPPREFARLAATAAPEVGVRVLEPGESLSL